MTATTPDPIRAQAVALHALCDFRHGGRIYPDCRQVDAIAAALLATRQDECRRADKECRKRGHLTGEQLREMQVSARQDERRKLAAAVEALRGLVVRLENVQASPASSYAEALELAKQALAALDPSPEKETGK